MDTGLLVLLGTELGRVEEEELSREGGLSLGGNIFFTTELFFVLGKTVWVEDMVVDVEGDKVGRDVMEADVEGVDMFAELIASD